MTEISGGYRVDDANGTPLGYFYGHTDREIGADGRKLTWDEARRMALNFARLPMLLGAGGQDGA